jgi:hypothetical protein
LDMHSSFGKMSRPHTQASSTWQCPINITIWKLPPNTTQPKDTRVKFPKEKSILWFTMLMFINGMETFVCIPSCLIINKETSFLFCHISKLMIFHMGKKVLDPCWLVILLVGNNRLGRLFF